MERNKGTGRAPMYFQPIQPPSWFASPMLPFCRMGGSGTHSDLPLSISLPPQSNLNLTSPPQCGAALRVFGRFEGGIQGCFSELCTGQ